MCYASLKLSLEGFKTVASRSNMKESFSEVVDKGLILWEANRTWNAQVPSIRRYDNLVRTSGFELKMQWFLLKYVYFPNPMVINEWSLDNSVFKLTNL